MSNYYAPQQPAFGAGAGGAPGQGGDNLQFYQSSYPTGQPSPQNASYGAYGAQPSPGQFGAGPSGFNSGFGGGAAPSGRMGEQGGLRTGWLAALSTEGYDGEPPLLEELGINFGHIKSKTLAVLNPFRRIDQHLMDDSDIAGPVLFFVLFGTVLLFGGKLHFGYVYGLALLGSISLHVILSLMTPSETGSHETDSHSHPTAPQYSGGAGGYPGAQGADTRSGHFSSTLTFARSSSILGYCLLPLVGTSTLGIVLPMDTFFGIVVTSAAIMWSTYSASGMFVAVGRHYAMRALVAYPLALFYVGFGIMSIFSARGSKSLASGAQL